MSPSRAKWWSLGLAIVAIALSTQQGIARPKKQKYLMRAATEPYMVLADAGCINVEIVLLDEDVPSGRATLESLLRKDVEGVLGASSVPFEGCSEAAPSLRVLLAAFQTSTWGFVVEVSLQELVTVERTESRPPLRILSMAPTYRVLRLGAVEDDKDPAGHMRRTVSDAVKKFAEDYVRANLREP